MGSEIMHNPNIIGLIFSELKSSGLFFLDATGSSSTLSKLVGDSLGLDVLMVTHFINSETDEVGAIESRLLEIALNGRISELPVIIKCDMTPAFLKAFANVNKTMRAWGVNFVYVSELVKGENAK